jgi:hypothetical protein
LQQLRLKKNSTMNIVSRKCKDCGEEKEIELFRLYNKKYGVYRMGICIICENKRTSNYYFSKKTRLPIKKVESLEEEIWQVIPGFEGIYEISNFGRVKSLKREVRAINHHSVREVSEKIISHWVNVQNDYVYVSLCKDGVKHNETIHVLIARCFIPNPLNLPEVNHKNGNKRDFSISNLEWNTTAQNAIHKFQVLGYKTPYGEKNKLSKVIIMIHPDGKEEKIKGITEAARRLGSPHSASVSGVLRGKKKSYKGFKFKYA